MQRMSLCLLIILAGARCWALEPAEPSLESWSGLIHDQSIRELPRGVETRLSVFDLEEEDDAVFFVAVIKDNMTLKAFTKVAGGFFPEGNLNVKQEVLVVVVLKRYTNAIHPESLTVSKDGTANLTIQWDGIQPAYGESFPAACKIVPKDVRVIHVNTGDRDFRLATIKLGG